MKPKHNWQSKKAIAELHLAAEGFEEVKQLRCNVCGLLTEVPLGTRDWQETTGGKPCDTVHQEGFAGLRRKGIKYNPALCGWDYSWREPRFSPQGTIRDQEELDVNVGTRRYQINCPDCLLVTSRMKHKPSSR